MAELDTFAKLITAVHEILPNAVIEEQNGQLVIFPGLKEERGTDGNLRLVPIPEEEDWIESAEFEAWLEGK